MKIDDKIGKALDNLSRESQLNVSGELFTASVAAIPFAGGAIASLLGGHHRRFIQERAEEVFKAMKERLEGLDESKVDKYFFESDEFQVLLAVALNQLQTTRDKDKLEMLACGLANGGLVKFSSETRKELFMSILRDLSSSHVRLLRRLLPNSELWLNAHIYPALPHASGEELAILQNLTAYGLVEQFFTPDKNLSSPRYGSEWTEQEIKRALRQYLKEILEPQFRITSFGVEFLNYFGQRVSLDEEKR